MEKSVGIDIGGTKISIAAVDQAGQIQSQLSFPTDAAKGFDRGARTIIAAIESLIEQAGWTTAGLSGIGIGCTGPVDPIRGTIHNPHTLPTWDDRDLVTPLADHFSTRVRLENDADAAAVGESRFGVGRNRNPIVMLTFGTGIGFGAIVNGDIYRGVDGAHPELGHIPTQADGPDCYCGIRGCFESVASGAAIESRGRDLGFVSSPDVFRAALSGNAGAKEIVDDAIRATVSACWTIAHGFLSELIVLGGGIMDDHYDLFASAITDSLRRAVMIPVGRTSVVKAALGQDAGVIGAASLVMQRSLN